MLTWTQVFSEKCSHVSNLDGVIGVRGPTKNDITDLRHVETMALKAGLEL